VSIDPCPSPHRVKMLIGYDPEELLGSHAYDFFHPSDFKACAPGSERAVKCKLTRKCSVDASVYVLCINFMYVQSHQCSCIPGF